MSKKSTRVVAALATALIASTVLASSAAEAAPKTLTIVYQGPLTGANAQTGQDQVLGVKTALEIYNATNPAVKVNLLQADDQGDASVASTVAAGIATNPSVIGVVGPAYSGASIASFPAYIASGLPQVSPSATNVFLDLIAKGDLTRPAIESGIANGTFPIVGGGSISFTRYGEVKGGAPIGEFQVVNGAIKYLGAE